MARTGLLVAGLSVACTALGCSDDDEEAPAPAVEEGPIDISKVPVPAVDAPPLYVVRNGLAVSARPESGAPVIGVLRAGATVPRSEQALTTKDCADGWYAIRPQGFVCLTDGGSLQSGPSGLTPPALDKALPYRYAELQSATPIYGRLPTPDEQVELEPKLKNHLASAAKKADVELGNAANDVPLDERGVPSGPPVLLPQSEGANAEGQRIASLFLQVAPGNTPPTADEEKEAKIDALARGSRVALVGTVESEGPSGVRSFSVLPDGSLIPTDRLEPELGSTYHGIDLSKTSLPIAFVHRYGTKTYRLEDSGPTAEEEEPLRRMPIPLTGRFRTVNGARFDEASDGYWLRAQDIINVIKRHKLPDFATGNQKWVDVSLALQYAVLYEGTKPVYAMLISSGRDRLGEPETSAATPRGDFRLAAKFITKPLDGREVDRAFEVRDVPWVLELDSLEGGQSFSVFANVWRDRIGESVMFRGIALTPIDAHRLWSWAGSPVPEGWHGQMMDGEAPPQVIFNVRK